MASEHQKLLLDVLAKHFPGCRLLDGDLALGFGDLTMSCEINRLGQTGGLRSASIWMWIRGGLVGSVPVFMSVTGYDPISHDNAIVMGACNWADGLAPVLRAGFAGERPPELASFEAELDGQRFEVFVADLDRVLTTAAPSAGAENLPHATRARFGGSPWFAPKLIDSNRLPIIESDRPTLLSTFVLETPKMNLIEVKVNGVDWHHAKAALEPSSQSSIPHTVTVRELAVLVPRGAPGSLSRARVVSTIQELEVQRKASPRALVGWPGWHNHRGQLDRPLTVDELASVERELGVLPGDYRQFLCDVGQRGAGPGYGLLSPLLAGQARLAQGTFEWEEGDAADGAPSGVLALAHAGCGIMWLLVLRGPRCGEVWADARSTDGTAKRVASSFSAWYRAWLSAVAGDLLTWVQWDAAQCSAPNLLSELIEKDVDLSMLEPGAIALASGDSVYFAASAFVDPCQACSAVADELDLDPQAFRSGAEPLA